VVVEWDPLILRQELAKQEEAAAAEPAGWLDQTPWEERRRAFSQIFCPLLPWGHPDQDRDITFRVEKNDHLAEELGRAGDEAGLIPAWRSAWNGAARVHVSWFPEPAPGERLARLSEEGPGGAILPPHLGAAGWT
jgi:hypothetical protein